MDLLGYCCNTLEPTLAMLVDIYKEGGIRFEDAQRIGGSMCEVDSVFDEIYESFEMSLEKVKIRKG